MRLAEHRLAAAIVATAFAVTAGFFMFGMPKGPQYDDNSSPVVFPSATPPDHGWTWSHGTPGFVFGQYDDLWNMGRLRPENLDGLRAAAPRFGVAPQSLRILWGMGAVRSKRPQLLVAGSDAAGRTCIGIQPHHGRSRFLCQGQLAGTPGIVVVEAMPKEDDGYWLPLSGLIRGDVTRVTVVTPGSAYPKQPVFVWWWGTFAQSALQPGPWHAIVTFYGRHGRLGSADVRFAHSGERVVLTSSARRSA